MEVVSEEEEEEEEEEERTPSSRELTGEYSRPW